MHVHNEIVALPQDVADARLRLVVAAKAAGVSFAAIERRFGLARGSISSYVGRRLYAYPKLQQAVVEHLAGALDQDEEPLRAYLFLNAEPTEP